MNRKKGRSNHQQQTKPNLSQRSQGRTGLTASKRAARARKPEYRSTASRSPQETTWVVEQPEELLPNLLANIKHKSRNNIKSILTRGQVSVNGQVKTRHDEQLQRGATVKVSWEIIEDEVPLLGIDIAYEDEDLIVVDKEAGLLTIATNEEKEETAYRYMTEYVRSKDPAGRVFIVHRLDRDTSGLLIFAKQEEIKLQLQEAWQETVPERTYVALVEGEVRREEGTIRSWLKETKTLRMYSSPVPNGGQEAVTHYKVLARSASYSLLEVRLETGRKNQIRVHMETIGHSVAGDKKYGAKTDPLRRLGLHAATIAFYHPSSGELMRFESSIPKSFQRIVQA